MTVAYNDIVFAFSMEEIYSVGATRFLRDRGPNQFDFQFPGGGADPTPTLTGELAFNGAQYLSLPTARLAEFYARMPTREHTTLMCGTHTDAVATCAPFSCDNNNGGGVWKGLLTQVIADGRILEYQLQGAAATPTITVSAPIWPMSRKRVVAATVEAVPRTLADQALGTSAWTAGAFGACVYDTAIIPRIGARPAGGNEWIGRLSYLSLIRGALSSPDLSQLSRMLSEGLKPFCGSRF